MVAAGSNGADFSPFGDTGRTIYSTDPYREPTELYANPGPPATDFGAHVSSLSQTKPFEAFVILIRFKQIYNTN